MNANQVRKEIMNKRNEEVARQFSAVLADVMVAASRGFYHIAVGLQVEAIVEKLAQRKMKYCNGVVDISESSLARQADAFWANLTNAKGMSILDANFDALSQANACMLSGDIRKADLELSSFVVEADVEQDFRNDFTVAAAVFLERKGFKSAIAGDLVLTVGV